MSIFSVITNIIKPVGAIIDNLHTSGEEKGALKAEFLKLENAFASKVLEYEQTITKMQADVIMTEAKGEGWLQRSWRPVTMLTLLALVVGHYLGLLAVPIAHQMWTLLQLGIGGYIGGRSLEKVASSVPSIVAAVKRKASNG